jgi:type IV secretory pathway VirB6-like protein
MKFIRRFILLALISLSSCDYGCISADNFGSLKLKRISLFANPVTESGLRPGLIVETTKPNLANDKCIINRYWTPLNEQYNSSYKYNIKLSGFVNFCRPKSLEDVSNHTVFKLNVITDDDSYKSNQNVNIWQNAIDKSKNAVQLGVLPEINCQDKAIELRGYGNKINIYSGTHSKLSDQVRESLESVKIPRGCAIDLYDRVNNEGWKLNIDAGKDSREVFKDYNLQGYIRDNNLNTCQGKSILKIRDGREFFVHGVGHYCIRDHSIEVDFALENNLPDVNILNHFRFTMNDQVTDVKLPPGCRLQHSNVCNLFDVYELMSGDENLANLPHNISSLSISQASNYSWVKNISSAYVYDNPDTKQLFSDTNNMQAQYHEKVFGNKPALRFDGINDFYNFDDAKHIFNKEYLVSFIIKPLNVNTPLKGTLFSSNISGGLPNERYFIEEGRLIYQYKEQVSQVIFDQEINSDAIITIHRKDNKLTVKVNSLELQTTNLSNHINEDVDLVSIGSYLDYLYYPQDFFQGYIGEVSAYKKDNEGLFPNITTLTNDLIISWEVMTCNLGKSNHSLRLKIGSFHNNDLVFDKNNNFFIPDDYKDKTGKMFFRIADPEVEAKATKPSLCNNITDNYYQDNQGKVNLNVQISKNNTTIAQGLYKSFIIPIEEYLLGNPDTKDIGIEEHFFTKVTAKGGIINNVLILALTFLVAFTGIGYLVGFIKYSQWELTIKIIKLAVVIALVSASSWDFFAKYAIDFFRTSSLDLVGDILLMGDMGGDITSYGNNGIEGLFSNLDNILGLFISAEVNGKILGLLFFPIFTGALMVLMFYYSFYIFIHIIAKVLILYVSIFIMMSFAFIIAPIFIIFILFEKTKDYFSKWLDLVLGYSVQFIFLALVVGVFSWIILALFLGLLDYTVCWKPIYYCCGGQDNFVLFSFFRPSSYDYRRFASAIKEQYVPGFLDVALFLLVIYFFKEFLNFMMDLATQISGGISVSSISDSIGKSLGTDDMKKSISNAADNTAKYGLRAAGAVASSVGMLAAGGVAAYKKVQTSRGKGYQAGGGATSFANFMLGKGRKLNNDTYYRKGKAKLSLYNMVGKKLDDSLFGIKQPKEKMLIADIQKTTKEALLKSAKEGVSQKSRQGYIKEAVSNMLKSKGYDDKKITKITNSSQLAHDIKYSQLQVSDAEKMLKDSYLDAYNEAIKNKMDDPDGEAMKAYEKVQQNIGQSLSYEKEMQDNRSNIFGFNLRRGASKVWGNSAERRLADIARMSENLKKNLVEENILKKHNKSKNAIENVSSYIADKKTRYLDGSLKGRMSYQIKDKATQDEAKKFLSQEDKSKKDITNSSETPAQKEDLDQKLNNFFTNKNNKNK